MTRHPSVRVPAALPGVALALALAVGGGFALASPVHASASTVSSSAAQVAGSHLSALQVHDASAPRGRSAFGLGSALRVGGSAFSAIGAIPAPAVAAAAPVQAAVPAVAAAAAAPAAAAPAAAPAAAAPAAPQAVAPQAVAPVTPKVVAPVAPPVVVNVPAPAPVVAKAVAPVVAAAPAAGGIQTSLDVFETRLAQDINGARANAGESGLTVVTGYTDVARAWAQQQAAAKTLKHNPNSTALMASHGGGNWGSLAENVGYITLTTVNPGTLQTAADSLFQQYMNSPAHKANILGVNSHYLGIGAWSTYLNGQVAIYNTQNFCDTYAGYGGAQTSPWNDSTVG